MVRVSVTDVDLIVPPTSAGSSVVYKRGLRAEGPCPPTDCSFGSLACG